MRRGLAIAIILIGLADPARAETNGIAPDAARCEPESTEATPLTGNEIAFCRQLWRDKVEGSRQRADTMREAMIRSSRELRMRQAIAKPPPVELGTFLQHDNLAYGDVVVLPNGPRVFIGRPFEPARADDFVAVDSSRSPHRRSMGAYRGALPTFPAAPLPDQPPTRQERRP